MSLDLMIKGLSCLVTARSRDVGRSTSGHSDAVLVNLTITARGAYRHCRRTTHHIGLISGGEHMADITKRPFLSHFRGSPTAHVVHVKNGKTAHEGTGQAFWFRPLTAVLAEVPVDDRELPM